MNFLPFLHFFAFLVYLYLAVFVIYKNPKSHTNRTCAILLVCLAIWNFGHIFVHDLNTSKNIAKLFNNIGSLGWISSSSLFLWFSLIFAKKKILKTKLLYPLLFILPLLFIYKQWTNSLIVDYIKQPYGWSDIWSESIWPYLFHIYYLSFVITSLCLILNFGEKTKKPREKKQANLIFASVVICLIPSLLTDTVFPALNIYKIPPVANVITLIWGGGIVYAITKYKLMTITSAAAAADILTTMANSLILISPDAKILTVNPATVELLGYEEEELIGQPVGKIFIEEVTLFKGARLKKLIEEGFIRDYDMTYKTKLGEKIPVSFSGSAMRNKEGELVGIVGIAKDMRETRKLIADLEVSRDEIEEYSKTLEEGVAKRTEELSKTVEQLEKFAEVAVGRELKMAKMEKEMESLKGKLRELTSGQEGVKG